MAFRKNCELNFCSKEYVGGRERKEKSGRGGKQKTTVGLDSMLRRLDIIFRQRLQMGLLGACRFDLSESVHLPLTTLPGHSLVACD